MELKKELFEEPEMEVVELDKVDVLTTSPGGEEEPAMIGLCLG